MSLRFRENFLACVQCGRIFRKNELKEIAKKMKSKTLICPYCGSTEFTTDYENVVLVADPNSSIVAKKLKISSKGIFAVSWR